ncbi:MAG: Rieske (2Fe-2S) protein [Myxococcota bacterium]
MKQSRRQLIQAAFITVLAACTGRNPNDSGQRTGTDTPDNGGSDDMDGRSDSAEPTDDIPCDDGEPGSEADGWVALSLDDYPELANVFGNVDVRINDVRLIIAQVAQDCYIALDRVCTHNGCDIGFREDGARFVCPCHGGLFGYDGAVLGGPPNAPVRAFPAVRVDGLIWVQVPT